MSHHHMMSTMAIDNPSEADLAMCALVGLTMHCFRLRQSVPTITQFLKNDFLVLETNRT